ncbi:MAG TPA: glycosyltransferase family 2 protein [Elusimicrobiota bacterium]|nr:glycosyltransferase family 2 protein [Elusimicrobiota bacterium]
MPESIAIGIAAFNEEATVETVVRDSLRILSALTSDYEVVVVDDGSADATASILERLGREQPALRVIRHPRNLGFGRTLRDIWTLPTKDWIFFLPGDGQIPPEELRRLWPARERADFIIGWRRDRQDPWIRDAFAYVYNLVISAGLRRRVRDVDSVCLVRSNLLRQMALTSISGFIHAECCLKANASGARIAELPIAHRPRIAGHSRGVGLANMLRMSWELCCYAVRLGR